MARRYSTTWSFILIHIKVHNSSSNTRAAVLKTSRQNWPDKWRLHWLLQLLHWPTQRRISSHNFYPSASSVTVGFPSWKDTHWSTVPAKRWYPTRFQTFARGSSPRFRMGYRSERWAPVNQKRQVGPGKAFPLTVADTYWPVDLRLLLRSLKILHCRQRYLSCLVCDWFLRVCI
jgi:hypothetical protein